MTHYFQWKDVLELVKSIRARYDDDYVDESAILLDMGVGRLIVTYGDNISAQMYSDPNKLIVSPIYTPDSFKAQQTDRVHDRDPRWHDIKLAMNVKGRLEMLDKNIGKHRGSGPSEWERVLVTENHPSLSDMIDGLFQKSRWISIRCVVCVEINSMHLILESIARSDRIPGCVIDKMVEQPSHAIVSPIYTSKSLAEHGMKHAEWNLVHRLNVLRDFAVKIL